MALSPMMRQYLDIKSQYKDDILFFRLGDFYEMFYDDAKTVSRELELVLTGKDCGEEERAPMCGIPFHSADGYIEKHFGEIVGHENDIEKREVPTGCTVSGLQKDNRRIAEGFRKAGERVVRIRSDYGRTIRAVLEQGPRPEE